MGPLDATINCLRHPFKWKGRAAPSEYWWFTLVMTIIYTAVTVPLMWPFMSEVFAYMDAVERAHITAAQSGAWTPVVMPPEPDFEAIAAAQMTYWLAFLIISIWPTFSSLSVSVRRLHDTGRSGWWYWIFLVPFVGPIVLLIFLIIPSEIYTNKFGPKPGAGAVPKVKRGSDMPVVERNPLDDVKDAESLRALRASRMPNI